MNVWWVTTVIYHENDHEICTDDSHGETEHKEGLNGLHGAHEGPQGVGGEARMGAAGITNGRRH